MRISDMIDVALVENFCKLFCAIRKNEINNKIKKPMPIPFKANEVINLNDMDYRKMKVAGQSKVKIKNTAKRMAR